MRKMFSKGLGILIAAELALISIFSVGTAAFAAERSGTDTLSSGPVRGESSGESSGECGDSLTWTLDGAGTLTISGSGEMRDYSLDSGERPPWYDRGSDVKQVVLGKGVTSIGNYAFVYCSSLQGITVPASVTSIGVKAFGGCSSLTSIRIPAGVTNIENYTFEDCGSLQSVMIPAGVTSIGQTAFGGCGSLKSITIPAGVKSIGEWAFSKCSSLTSITIPSGVTGIEKASFYQCGGLNSIVIPSSVENIGPGAFEDCISLTDAYYDGSAADWTVLRSNIDVLNDPLTSESCEKHYEQTFATGVSLDKEDLTLIPGETAVLSAAVNPQNAILAESVEEPIIWISADPRIAEVDKNGTVTAAAKGQTTITAMSAVWGYSADCSVVVKKAEGTEDDSSGDKSGGDTDSSKRTKPANTYVGGQKVDVKALYFGNFPGITRFLSSSKKTASVSKKGILKAKKPGTVTIEAQTGKKKAERKTVSSCNLTILDRPKLKFKEKYSASTDIGKVLDGYEFFTTESTKQTAADFWESSKPAVAEVNPETGMITIKGKGTATITAYFGEKGEKGTLKVKAKLKVKR